MLRDLLKESQLEKGDLISEDLLIRSQRESMKNMVPFLLRVGREMGGGVRDLCLSLEEQFRFVPH